MSNRLGFFIWTRIKNEHKIEHNNYIAVFFIGFNDELYFIYFKWLTPKLQTQVFGSLFDIQIETFVGSSMIYDKIIDELKDTVYSEKGNWPLIEMGNLNCFNYLVVSQQWFHALKSN